MKQKKWSYEKFYIIKKIEHPQIRFGGQRQILMRSS